MDTASWLVGFLQLGEERVAVGRGVFPGGLGEQRAQTGLATDSIGEIGFEPETRVIDASHATGSARCAATESTNPIEWRPAFRLAEVTRRHQEDIGRSERGCRRCRGGRRCDARRREREIDPTRKQLDGAGVVRRSVVMAVSIGVQCTVCGRARGEDRQTKDQTRAASRHEPTKSVGREHAGEKEHGGNPYIGMIARRVKSNCVLSAPSVQTGSCERQRVVIRRRMPSTRWRSQLT